ncbi:unnamed protein product [Symbiodinium necroappetens]|uniref:Uncharacterized protein n=1 Tax=Symbiodinium necroappetens TaxID=1628268 RepID=A0A813A3D8_9DINO|nr:unnamed protein product [Symbiodinium necroappetens]
MRWCQKVAGHGAEPFIFGDITRLLGDSWYTASMTYSQRLQAGLQTPLVSSMHCQLHRTSCPLPCPIFDVSGLPCPDMSAAGKRLKRAGETNAVYIAHGRFVTAKRTPLLLVECTKDLDMGMLEDTHPDHDFYQMFSEPSDFGFRGLSRFRTWVVGSHREKSTCLHDPFELLEDLKSAFSELPGAGVSDFLVASEAELHLEAAALARRRKKAVPSLKNLSGLLNVRELLCKQQLDDKYLNQRAQHPSRNPNLVYYLGDSAEYCTWSAKSDKIPTYRLGARSGLYWLPGQGR